MSDNKTTEMYKYIEVIEDKTKNVVRRYDVTNYHEKRILIICSGLEMNMNHNTYLLQVKEYEIEQEIIEFKTN